MAMTLCPPKDPLTDRTPTTGAAQAQKHASDEHPLSTLCGHSRAPLAVTGVGRERNGGFRRPGYESRRSLIEIDDYVRASALT